MKSLTTCIYTLAPFLISFCFSEGFLNNNSYIKQFAVGAVLLIQGIVYFLIGCSWKSTNVSYNVVDILVASLLVLYSCFFTGTKNSLDLLIPYVYFCYYFFLRFSLPCNLGNIKKGIFSVVTFVICVHYLIVLLQYLRLISNLHSFFLIGSTFGNPDKFGSYLTILFSISMTKDDKKKIDYILLIIGIIILIVLQARTSLLAMSIVLIYYLISKKKISKKILCLSLSCFILGFIFLVLWHPQSVSGRIFIWIISLKMFLNRLQGYGLYAFQKDFLEQQVEFINKYPGFSALFNLDQVYSPFNEFIYVGVSLGLIGLLLYISLVVKLLILSYRSQSVFIYPLIAFLIISISYFPFKIAPIAIIMIMIVAIVASSSSSRVIKNMKVFKPIIVAVLILTSLSISSFNYNTFEKWRKATDNSSLQTELSKEKMFSEIYPHMKENGLFLFSYANYNYTEGNLNKAIYLMEEANKYYINIDFFNFSATMYEQLAETAKAEVYLKKALSLSNGQYNATYNLILFLIRIGNTHEAYQLAINLYNKPVDSFYYIDVQMIRSRLESFIEDYENTLDMGSITH